MDKSILVSFSRSFSSCSYGFYTMTDPMEKVEVIAFDRARIRALDQYSLLENALAMLLMPLLKVKREAFTIFFRITNTRSRYSIIDALLRDANEPEAHKFWKSIEKQLQKLDNGRNQIVHWNAVVDLGTVGRIDQPDDAELKYLQPGHSPFAESPRMTMEAIEAFAIEAGRLSVFVTTLNNYLAGRYDEECRAALQGIFLQPINDRTLEELLSLLIPKAPEHPPQSSEA